MRIIRPDAVSTDAHAISGQTLRGIERDVFRRGDIVAGPGVLIQQVGRQLIVSTASRRTGTSDGGGAITVATSYVALSAITPNGPAIGFTSDDSVYYAWDTVAGAWHRLSHFDTVI